MSDDVIRRVRDMPAMTDIERITGRGPELYSLILRDGSVVLCTRGVYRRLFDEARDEVAEEPGEVEQVRARLAQEQAERLSPPPFGASERLSPPPFGASERAALTDLGFGKVGD